ncbi:1-deoxy-D-xylulose-5-phosphate reductoisomerase, partial [Gammaproteobacteria bacterium]|nr:1-deoxy-D-xylulose-5-phosphate reductoisomerase [Gammaproteobacteria bacterium]
MELNTLASDASLALLGSTGSIGESTLAVTRKIENLSIFALTANTNAARLLAQCLEFNPRYAVLVDSAGADQLAKTLRAAGCNTELLVGPEALDQVAADAEVDMVMAAIVGAAGLASTLAAAT